MKPAFALFIAALTFAPTAQAQQVELISGQTDRQALSLTIYNQGVALIREKRSLSLGTGEQRVNFADVSAQIRPETTILDVSGTQILEQNFDFDLLTPAKLLEKAVGERVHIHHRHPTSGEEIVEEAEVLATNNGVVLQIGNRIEALQDVSNLGRIVFDTIPENLRARPTLSVLLDSESAGPRDVDLSYLSGGLGWNADYVGRLNAEETELSLQGWITLTNQSGTAFENAVTQLVAGELNLVRGRSPQVELQRRREDIVTAAAGVGREQLGDYHLYTLPRSVTIADNQTKQVSFLTAPAVKFEKSYRFEARYLRTVDEPYHADVWLTFTNSKSGGLGLPLPQGIVRVYAEDSAGRTQFMGEDAIDHTPENGDVQLRLGTAFDVTITMTQTDYRLIARSDDHRVVESTHEVVVANGREEDVSVAYSQHIDGEWEILSESLPHRRRDSARAGWDIEVPPKGESTLTFTVRRRY